MIKLKLLTTFFPKKYFPFEIFCLMLISVVVYWGTLDHTFHGDDNNITNEPSIQISSLSAQELIKAGFEPTYYYRRPVSNISFALNYYFHGLETRGYHVVNIIIHILTGIMLFYFIRKTLNIRVIRDRFGDAGLIPFFTALVFLVHPLHTQAVTYIVQRMTSMAALFYIMAMLFYVKGRLAHYRGKRILFFVISLIAGLLAFGTKENTATLPLFILIYELYFFQDLRLQISRKKVFWIITISCIAGILLLSFLISSSQLSKIINYDDRPFTLAERLLTQPRVVLHYLSLLSYPEPSRLNFDYDFSLSHSLLSPFATLLAILMIIVMLVLAIYISKNNRLYSFCILWFLGNLVIESSIIPLEIIFEHRTYLPSMMAILLLVMFLREIFKKRESFLACLVLLSLLFSYWTYARNKVYQDDLTLWADIYKKSPNKARVNQNYGAQLSMAGRADKAIPILENALRLYREEIKGQFDVDSRLTALHLRNLGVAYKNNGEYKIAIVYLERALKEFPFDASTYYELGNTYSNLWKFDEAVYYFSKALEFSKHHKTDVLFQKNIMTIKQALEKAQRMLKAQKERQFLLQKKI
jgi:tetratricopeptide (TPR) repeat protein